MLFYCQLPNKEVAFHTKLSEIHGALVKHRCLQQIRNGASLWTRGTPDAPNDEPVASDILLTEVWEEQRPSCPKRSTIGAHLLETLESDWQHYVKFHLNPLGCRFCLANIEDLQA